MFQDKVDEIIKKLKGEDIKVGELVKGFKDIDDSVNYMKIRLAKVESIGDMTYEISVILSENLEDSNKTLTVLKNGFTRVA